MKFDRFEDFLNSIKDTTTPIKEKWSAENKILTKKYNKFKVFLVIFDIIIVLFITKYLNVIRTPNFNSQLVSYCFIALLVIFIDFFLAVFYELLTFSKNTQFINKEYKEKVFTKMLENFVDELKYEPQTGISRETYKEAKYINDYDDFHSEDYFTGKINNQKIEMSDLKITEEVEEEDKDGNKTTHTRTLFSGLFGKIKLNKSIDANVQITKGDRFSIKDSKRLNMDSTEFETSFDVYTNNPIVAMQILTVSIEEDMTELQKEKNIQFGINIIDDNMYVVFHTENMFEIYRGDEKSDEILEKYFEIMKFISKIINKITQAIDDTKI